MDARPGDTSTALAVLLLAAAIVIGLEDHLAAAAVLGWGCVLLIAYGRFLDTTSQDI